MKGGRRIKSVSTPSAATRRASVADVIAIHQLKARYAWFADSKYAGPNKRLAASEVDRAATGQASCFTEDAVWRGGKQFGATIKGRAALLEFFRRAPWNFALHYYVAPMIEVRGNEASGRWRLWQVGIPRGAKRGLLFAAVTSECYRRVKGQWLHSEVEFESVHFIRTVTGANAGLEFLAKMP